MPPNIILPEDHEIISSWASSQPHFDCERTWLFGQAESPSVIMMV